MYFGVASGVLGTIAFVPYIADTLAGRTRPQRASWLIWSILGSIAVMSQIYEGATVSLWFAVVQVGGTIIVFVISIWAGTGRFLSKTDYYILGLASIGLLLWYFTETAAYALAITISISLLGGLATVVKAWHYPHSETLSTWVVALLASCFAILSVGDFNPIIVAYPLYLFTLYLAFIVAICLGRLRQRIATENNPGTPAGPAMMPVRPAMAPLISGLRVTADAVIVAAAGIYLVNWTGAVDAGSHRFSTDRSAHEDVPPMTDVVPAALPTAPDSKATQLGGIFLYGDTHEAEIPEVFNELLAGNSLPGIPTLESARPRLEESKYIQSSALAVNSAFINAAISARPVVEPGDRQSLSQVRSGAREGITKVNNTYMTLDSGDPFAKLIVTGETAWLQTEDVPGGNRNHLLEQGDRLSALATNSVWFLVRTDAGRIGYLHHSRVSVEHLASLSGIAIN